MFELARGLDPQALRKIYDAHGRLQITDFLTRESALALYEDLAQSTEWRLTVNRGEEILHFGLDELGLWEPAKAELLEKAVTSGGRFGFQFRYDVIRKAEGSDGLLTPFTEFMCSDNVLDLMRAITGADDVAFADAHASRYRAGHFLTTHDDKVDSMGRRAAYVLNLTPKWRPDWGGLLQFFDSRGDVVRAFTPGFNTLNVFRVPQAHNVSWVTPLAGAPRYAVTGWLRANS